MSRARVLLHMPRHMLDEAKLPWFYKVPAAGLRERGAEVALIWRDKAARLTGPDAHFVHNGAAQGPGVLFGRSDLHHCAETVVRPADWDGALQRALTHDWPYEAFVHWFVSRSLRAGPAMIDPVLQRIAAAGGDLAALGLG